MRTRARVGLLTLSCATGAACNSGVDGSLLRADTATVAATSTTPPNYPDYLLTPQEAQSLPMQVADAAPFTKAEIDGVMSSRQRELQQKTLLAQQQAQQGQGGQFGGPGQGQGQGGPFGGGGLFALQGNAFALQGGGGLDILSSILGGGGLGGGGGGGGGAAGPSSGRDDAGSQYDPLRKFIVEFNAKVIKEAGLTFSQPIGATVDNDKIPNAFANMSPDASGKLTYKMSFTTEMLKMPAERLLVVYCHEMAHFAHMHMKEMIQNPEVDPNVTLADPDKQKPSKDAIGQYLMGQINQQSQQYTHNKAKYQQALQANRQIELAAMGGMIANEAEADGIGMRICARIGLSPERFAAGTKANQIELDATAKQMARQAGAKPPEEIADGESLPAPQQQLPQLQAYLFPLETHPKGPERILQADTIKGVLQSDYKESKLAEEFIAKLTEIGGKSGLGLADEPAPTFSAEEARAYLLRMRFMCH